MEKEKKGLFEMLAAFWKEKAAERQQETIGFRVKKTPKGKKDDSVLGEEEKNVFLKEERKDIFAEGKPFLLAESFWEEKEERQTKQGKPFFREETMGKRKIVPVIEEEIVPLQMEKTEEKQEEKLEPKQKKEERQQETDVDVETLMQEITKKLWEERESCGRRLR